MQLYMLVITLPISIGIALVLVLLDRRRVTAGLGILSATIVGAADGLLLATSMFPPASEAVILGAVVGFLAGRFVHCRVNWILGSLVGGLLILTVLLDAIDNRSNWGRGGLFGLAAIGFSILGLFAGFAFCSCRNGRTDAEPHLNKE